MNLDLSHQQELGILLSLVRTAKEQALSGDGIHLVGCFEKLGLLPEQQNALTEKWEDRLRAMMEREKQAATGSTILRVREEEVETGILRFFLGVAVPDFRSRMVRCPLPDGWVPNERRVEIPIDAGELEAMLELSLIKIPFLRGEED